MAFRNPFPNLGEPRRPACEAHSHTRARARSHVPSSLCSRVTWVWMCAVCVCTRVCIVCGRATLARPPTFASLRKKRTRIRLANAPGDTISKDRSRHFFFFPLVIPNLAVSLVAVNSLRESSLFSITIFNRF